MLSPKIILGGISSPQLGGFLGVSEFPLLLLDQGLSLFANHGSNIVRLPVDVRNGDSNPRTSEQPEEPDE